MLSCLCPADGPEWRELREGGEGPDERSEDDLDEQRKSERAGGKESQTTWSAKDQREGESDESASDDGQTDVESSGSSDDEQGTDDENEADSSRDSGDDDGSGHMTM